MINEAGRDVRKSEAQPPDPSSISRETRLLRDLFSWVLKAFKGGDCTASLENLLQSLSLLNAKNVCV